MTTAKDRSMAVLLLAITALLWSTGGLLIKLVDAHPLAIAGARSAVAVVVLLVLTGRPRLNWSPAQVGAALAYSATTILFVSATSTTTAANAVLLQFTAPVYVALLAGWILKEQTLMRDWVMVFAVLGGMTLFFYGNLDTREVLGNVIAAASGISFALFIIFMRMQKDGSPLESVVLGNILTAAIGLPVLLHSTPGPLGWLSVTVLGVVQMGIPYILFARAIRHATALDATLIPMLEPLLNPVWVFLALGETPRPVALLGGLIVLMAIAVRCMWSVVPSRPARGGPGSERRVRDEVCTDVDRVPGA